MIEIVIYLKNGVHFSIFVSSFTVKKNGLGEFAGLSWKDASADQPHLLHIAIEDVSAIVSTHHPKMEAPAPAGS